MTTKQSKPHKCEYCDSTKIIPMVNGSPVDPALESLVAQDKIYVRGSFQIVKGSVIWICADCHEGVQDEAYLYDESNSELMQAYEDAIKEAFENLEYLNESEIRKLEGRAFLRSLSQNYLSYGLFELEKSEESFWIKPSTGATHEYVTNSIIPMNYFGDMDDYLGEEGTKEFEVRINKEACVAVATRIAPGKIQVKRK
ncbi:hypothetical protein [Gimesia fumaroli]|uniref:Uncharacterized protein n=1 Tax=Gimesia fumaroli TaxID=2527976 RepID=A0A518IGJ8_9PLAN|nr:hypothetical protein [Gimesia fumaroli]QDV52185.1 hypothetical protein Enr17x_42450 [Gimesia fumaroli]